MSAFDVSNAAEARVLGRTFAGGSPGVVVPCVLVVIPRVGTPLRAVQTPGMGHTQ